MIKDFLEDLKKYTIAGIPLFLIGFIMAWPFLVFLGATMGITGLTFYTIVEDQYEKQKPLNN